MAHRRSAHRIAKARRVAHCRQRAASHAIPPVGKLGRSAFTDLEAGLTGHVVLPGDADYNTARQE